MTKTIVVAFDVDHRHCRCCVVVAAAVVVFAALQVVAFGVVPVLVVVDVAAADPDGAGCVAPPD